MVDKSIRKVHSLTMRYLIEMLFWMALLLIVGVLALGSFGLYLPVICLAIGVNVGICKLVDAASPRDSRIEDALTRLSNRR